MKKDKYGNYRTSVNIIQNGKTKKVTLRGKTKAELEEKKVEIKQQAMLYSDLNAPFGVWADNWLENRKLPSDISEDSKRLYQFCVDILKTEYNDVPFRLITLDPFQVFINNISKSNPLTGKEMSKSYIKKVIVTMNSICKYARGNRINAPDFFDQIIIPSNCREEGRKALDEKQISMIVDFPCPEAMIMLFAGLRKSELIPLEWDDIDFDNRLLYVNRTANVGQGKSSNETIVKEYGKSKNAMRVIPLPPILVDYLLEYKKIQRTELMKYRNALVGEAQNTIEAELNRLITEKEGYTIQEVSSWTGYSEVRIRKFCTNGTLKAHKYNEKSWMIDNTREELIEFFKERLTKEKSVRSEKSTLLNAVDSKLICTDKHFRMYTKSGFNSMWESYLKRLNDSVYFSKNQKMVLIRFCL